MPSVANAVAAGSSAAAMIVHDLMADAHGLAVGAGSDSQAPGCSHRDRDLGEPQVVPEGSRKPASMP